MQVVVVWTLLLAAALTASSGCAATSTASTSSALDHSHPSLSTNTSSNSSSRRSTSRSRSRCSNRRRSYNRNHHHHVGDYQKDHHSRLYHHTRAAASLTEEIPRGGGAKGGDEAVPIGTASIPSEIFNLIKCIVGAGVLGLPAGIAAFGDSSSAIIPAMVLLATIGFLSSYGFSVLGFLCGSTRSTTYRQAWSRSVGPGTSWMPALASTMVTSCSIVTYSMILSDTIPAILEGTTGIQLARNTVLLGLTLFILLPLCLMRELKSLAPFSLVGIIGVVYTAIAMTFRWLSNGYTTKDSQLASSLATELLPRFGKSGWKSVFSQNTAILISMLSTAFMAHYNAPKLFWELRDNTMPRFDTVVSYSFAGSVLLMAAIAMAGFGTFGAASSSLILNNYAVSDKLMSVSRIAVTVSLICGYPLAFVGVREGLLDLLSITDRQQRDKLSNPLTVGLLAMATGLAFVLTDIKIVLALGGATWGNCVIYLFPAYMLIRYAAQHPEDAALQRRVPRAVVTGLLGLVLAVVGTMQALQSA